MENKKMSAGGVEEDEGGSSSSSNFICPSKSTVYIANINYSLTNNDLMKIVEGCGKVVCAKVAKDKATRRSKGYAFVQFLLPEDAAKCIQEYNGVEMFGRTWKCSIAIDNGRTAEFIRKRVYPDKTRCYECGEFGHLSYKCPKNALGEREPPPKSKKRRKYGPSLNTGGDNDDQDSDSTEEANPDAEFDSLQAAINFERQKAEEQEYKEAVATGNYKRLQAESNDLPTKRFVKDGYFSDEEALEEVND